jgi:hypothetical protein
VPRPDERDLGSSSAELVVIAPLLLALLLCTVLTARLVLAKTAVAAAAAGAAQSAIAMRTAPSAGSTGEAVAVSELKDEGVTCQRTTFELVISDFVPGGQVRSDLSCAVAISLPGLAANLTTVSLSASAEAPLEYYRELSR